LLLLIVAVSHLVH